MGAFNGDSPLRNTCSFLDDGALSLLGREHHVRVWGLGYRLLSDNLKIHVESILAGQGDFVSRSGSCKNQIIGLLCPELLEGPRMITNIVLRST